ncbi:DUF3833 domain-containing protein [Sneathiella sp. CAU 1612]|uniref:DUF3833 domain-containing protein n=1 Tax=Sneathiella sedimenti TaxID=2816034 RepID=A0ABS3F4A3_9PROT|nr:DUF3833 domain-containing protein [Sneathiella sedimenti]MBO0333313.1 DUF3833 domain-containing protein [Sneathiella sedimenti]
MIRSAVVTITLVILAGCGGMKAEQFAETTPPLELFDYFEGETKAWGIFEDRFGNLRRQFEVTINGTVEGETLTLDEYFVYRDGETDRRVWTIQREKEHHYSGTAGDVVGTAKGVRYGNALNWRYDMDLKVGESVWRVAFDDWLFRQPGDVIINRATVTRWGFTIGTVTLFFMKDEASS